MSKFIEINGKRFEVIKSKHTEDMIYNWNYAGRSIYDCYDNPSHNKYCIWKMWDDWAYFADCVQSFGVKSYNTFTFTLGGILISKDCVDTPIGFIEITPAHNRLYLSR